MIQFQSIVTWTPNLWDGVLESVLQAYTTTTPMAEIIVATNASTDGHADMVRDSYPALDDPHDGNLGLRRAITWAFGAERENMFFD